MLTPGAISFFFLFGLALAARVTARYGMKQDVLNGLQEQVHFPNASGFPLHVAD